jgi:polyhydroxyalkanoate synthase
MTAPPRRAPVARTPRDTLLRDGSARLYRFRRPANGPGAGERGAREPLLILPSLIHRWYVLDLHPGSSLVEALVAGGIDTYCLDWGVPNDEDRYLGWDDLVARMERAVRRVLRVSGASRLALLGYSMGGTLSAIHAALHERQVAALVNLAGPIDFDRTGTLRTMMDARWFDAHAVAAAGNVTAAQVRQGFYALRPTMQAAKLAMLLEHADEPWGSGLTFVDRWRAIETWSNDIVPFPGAAYATWVGELWQRNTLVRGEHHARGRRVDLARITCPLLTICAERDAICPPAAAQALHAHARAKVKDVLVAPGGHVGMVIGRRAPRVLYPAIVEWLGQRLGAHDARASAEEACN